MKKNRLYKLVFFNLIVFFALIGFIFLIPPFTYLIYSKINNLLNLSSVNATNHLAKLPNYNNFFWAEDYYKEESRLTSSYHDYLIWRFDDFNGNHINIINGIRKTFIPKNITSVNQVFWFFGGSTTWGTGSNDNGTYPSIFSKKTNLKATNYGNNNFVARQSFELLFNEYLKLDEKDSTERVIVFYDGVNDVANFCSTELEGTNNNTRYEKYIQNEINIKTKANIKFSFSETFSQLLNFSKTVIKTYKEFSFQKFSKETASYYNCHLNPKKANSIAKNLVNVWEQAEIISKSKGDKFVAILQPVIFLGKPKKEYLNLKNKNLQELEKQFLSVYPLIIQYASAKEINFIDLTEAYNYNDFYYIDFCHVTPNAHEILVKKMILEFKKISLFNKEV